MSINLFLEVKDKKMLTYEQAREFTELKCRDTEARTHVKLESINFFELCRNEKELGMVKRAIDQRMLGIKNTQWSCSPLAYYINNVISVSWSPKRIGSFACDVAYHYAKHNKDVESLEWVMWWIINWLWYFDFVSDDGYLMEVESSDIMRLFESRLHVWLPMMGHNGKLVSHFLRYK